MIQLTVRQYVKAKDAASLRRTAVTKAKRQIIVSSDNVHIEDSYQIKSKSIMQEVLCQLRGSYPNCTAWFRSNRSLIREWRAHNLLYALHIERQRTKDVDLDWPTKWYTEVVYALLSILYFHYC